MEEHQNKPGAQDNRSGIALFITIIILSILSIIATQLALTTKVELALSQNLRSDAQNYYSTIAAINKAKLILSSDDTTFDALTDFWAKEREAEDFASSSIKYKIIDEDRKFNVNKIRFAGGALNTAGKAQFARLLRLLGNDDDLAEKIADSVADYLDENEEGDYEDGAKNDFLLMPEELLLVPEMTEDVFYGVKGEEEGSMSVMPLADFVTTWSSGYINMNTASMEVLMSLSDLATEDVASSIISYREQIGSDGMPQNFIGTGELNSVIGITPDVIAAISGKLTVQSQYFLIKIRSTNDNVSKESRAVLLKTPKGVRTVLFDLENKAPGSARKTDK